MPQMQISPPADNILARKMQQYMDMSGGGHFRCVLPSLLIHLDATTLLVHTRKTQTGGMQWYANSVDDTGKRRAIYTPGTSARNGSHGSRVSQQEENWPHKHNGYLAIRFNLFITAEKGRSSEG